MSAQFGRCLLFPAIFVLLGTGGCDDIYVQDEPNSAEKSEPLNYPINRIITDKHGRDLAVTLTGRSRSTVSFYRNSDGKAYTYDIRDLSSEDQSFIEVLPVTIQDSSISEVKPVGEEEAVEDSYVSFRRKEIADLRSKLAELKIAADSASPESGYLRRNYEWERDRIERRIAKLEGEIRLHLDRKTGDAP